MSKIWYCVNCGYEVGSRGRCHQCKEKLRQSPLPELAVGDEEDEVGYRLGDWQDSMRGRLIESLMLAGVEHRFEDDELVVAADDETEVDDLIASAAEVPADAATDAAGSGEVNLVEYVYADSSARSETYVPGFGLVDAEGKLVADGPAERGRAHFAFSPLDSEELVELAVQVRQLHNAAGRLRLDPTDMEADGDVAEASAAVFVTDQFPGLNTDTWTAVGRTTRRLLGALGSDEAQEEEISRQAGILCALLDVIADDAAEAQDAADTEAAGLDTAGLETAAGSDKAASSDTAAGSDVGGLDTAGLETAGLETAEADPDGAALADLEVAPIDLNADDETAESDEAGTGSDETVYELPLDWLPEQRAELTILLEEAGIVPTWDQGDLVVPAAHEAEVEALFDRIHGVSDDEAQDEAQYQEISELFAATSRLVGDPGDPSRAAEVLRTAPAVEGSTPFGFDGVKWSAIRKRTRLLADSIEHKAQRDVVAAEATSLRDLLRELV